MPDIDGSKRVRIRGQRNHPAFVGHGRQPTVVDGVGRDEALLECARDRNDFEDRPRLVDIGHRAVTLAIHRRELRVEEFIQVKRGPIGQTKDTASLGFADDDNARLRRILVGGLFQGDLTGILDEAVDREHNRAAVDGRDFAQAVAGNLATTAIALGFNPTLLPLEETIQRLFNTNRRHHLFIDVPHDVCRQLPFRVIPTILEFGPHGLELQFLDLLHGRLIAFPSEDDPADAAGDAFIVHAGSWVEGRLDRQERQTQNRCNLNRPLMVVLKE